MNKSKLGIFSSIAHNSWIRIANRLHSWVAPDGYTTGIEVYNCVAKGNVPVTLRKENFATWYTCGPTVYAPAHLGHASCYVKVDIIQRILKNYFNINLITAMNITDIDDKIIKLCNKDFTWQDVSTTNEKSFWEDLKELNVMEPDIKLRVSDHIPHIIDYISKLVANKIAYVGKDKSIYFKTSFYPGYGKLQKVSQNTDPVPDVKEAAADFVLWKAVKPNEPYWESPWGDGRPGWHIECSTMASRVFGDSVDFHAGGLDLRFPHHENEEAQSCAFHNKQQWVNYWLHTGQLFVKGDTEKMSKSLHNTISIREFLQQHSADEFRMACALSNYRNSMIYSAEMINTARNTLERLYGFISDCQAYVEGKIPPRDLDGSEILDAIFMTEKRINNSLKSDFDTAKSISHLSHLASSIDKVIHSNNLKTKLICSSNVDSVIAARNLCLRILSSLGFEVHNETKNTTLEANSFDIDVVLENLVMYRKGLRDEAKVSKNSLLFRISDELRRVLEASGVEVKDHENGSSWRVLKK